MKGFRVFAISIMIMVSLPLVLRAQSDVIADVKETLKAGSAKEFARYLFTTVDVELEGNKQSYSKAQAEFVFRDFFKQHPPNEVTVQHQGSSKGGQLYAILQYKSGTDNYRVFLRAKPNDKEQSQVYSVTFSKD
jgi:hypothetical protein